jgi:hypothetical protein
MEALATASKHTISDLERFYQTDDEKDKELFAEQRSNILMYSGEHYNRLRSTYYKRLREVKTLTEEQRIRLTKNHTQKIVDEYTNHVLSTAPGVGFEPANPSELQDQKTAELNHSVWDGAKEKYGLDEQTQDWCEDFTQIGEVATKIFWDPNEGKFLGEAMGEDGKMQKHFSGDFIFEEVFGFNLLIESSASNHRKATRMTVRKMVDVKKLKAMFGGMRILRMTSTSRRARIRRIRSSIVGVRNTRSRKTSACFGRLTSSLVSTTPRATCITG